ncbi:UNVERIFIED_CONTAM: Sphingosine-1-phosphate phosphatase 1 [Gekko kuhli]
MLEESLAIYIMGLFCSFAQYPVLYGLLLAFCWCSLVCFSRIYMGMHSVLDVIAGFFYAILILAVFLPVVDLVDNFNLTHKYAPLIIISLHLALGIFSFTLDTWSTSRGDTAQILGCGAGVACGSHVNYLLGLMPDPSPEALPLPVPPLTVTVLGKAMLRLLIGVVILLLTKMAMKKVTIPLACKIFGIPYDDIRRARQRMEVELPYRYITYGMVGFSLMFLIPSLFCIMGLS